MEIKFNNVSYLEKIKNINCCFQEGKITFITGSSGSGKTLMSYLMTGLVLPSSGCISIFNNVIDSDTKEFNYIRRNIGYVFQDAENSFFTTSVRKELEFGLKKYEYKLDNMEDRVLKSLRMVGLSDSYLDYNPFNLSSGEKEKLAFAISLSLNPKILILDEPTSYLDDKSKKELCNLLKKINKKYNKTIIIISNDIEFIMELADKVILLKKGNVVSEFETEKIFDNIELLKRNNIENIRMLEFIDMVDKYKNIKLTKTIDIEKLVSDIKDAK